MSEAELLEAILAQAERQTELLEWFYTLGGWGLVLAGCVVGWVYLGKCVGHKVM